MAKRGRYRRHDLSDEIARRERIRWDTRDQEEHEARLDERARILQREGEIAARLFWRGYMDVLRSRGKVAKTAGAA